MKERRKYNAGVPKSPILTPSLSLYRYSGPVVGGCIKMPRSEEFAGHLIARFQRLFSDINLHVMSLRFGDFRVGTTDFFAAKTRLRREWHVNG